MPKLRRAALALLVALTCLVTSTCSEAGTSTKQAATPSSAELAANIEEHAEIISDFDQVRAILVAKGDEIVHEQYFGTDADAYWGVQSVTKSVVSTLIGIALDEGLIASVDATLAELLPQHVDVMSPAVQATTLRQLLTMNAGFAGGLADTGPQGKHWVREILANPETPPGQGFVYSNGTSHLLAAIVEEATGTSALAYARSRLFGPLGIDTTPAFRRVLTLESLMAMDEAGFAWPVDPQGTSTGWFGLRLRPRDMLKIGQLFLDHGRWEGQQIVSAGVGGGGDQPAGRGGLPQASATATSGGPATSTATPSYRALGYGGQLVVVVPSRDLVVVTATELRQADVTSRGIDENVILAIIEDAVVSRFGPA